MLMDRALGRRLRNPIGISCLLGLAAACATSPTATGTVQQVSPSPTVSATKPPIQTALPHPTGIPVPFEPLSNSPIISPENAWSLRSIGVVPGRIYFSPTMAHFQWVTENAIEIIDVSEGVSVASLPGDSLVAFSPDGRRLAWSADEGAIHMRDLTGEIDDRVLDGFTPECCLRLEFSPDGNALMVIDQDADSQTAYGREVKLIDLTDEEDHFVIEDSDWAEFSPDGRRIGIQETQMIGVTLWDLNKHEKQETISGFSTAAPVYGVRFAPDWEAIAFWARAGGDVYDVSSGEKRFDFIGEPMSFNPAADTLATSETGWMSSECTEAVCLYDVGTGEIRSILSHGYVVWDLEFAPDGRLLATDGGVHVRMWDAEKSTEVANIPVDFGNVWSVGFSPDGRYLLAHTHSHEDEAQVVGLWAVDITAEASRIDFDLGATIWTTEVPARKGETQRFTLYALEGQTMQVFAGGEGTSLAILGEDGSELKKSDRDQPFWRGTLPAAQDYYVQLTTLDQDWAAESIPLSIAIAPSGQDSQIFSYADQSGQFELEYSDYFVVNPEPHLYPIIEGSELLRLKFVGSEFFEETNLIDAFVAIAVSDVPEIVASCTDKLIPNEQYLGTETLNEHTYSKWEGAEIAMGHLYLQTTYRTTVGGACYQVTLHEQSAVPDLFPPGEISEYDRTGLNEKFRSILRTIEFAE